MSTATVALPRFKPRAPAALGSWQYAPPRRAPHPAEPIHARPSNPKDDVEPSLTNDGPLHQQPKWWKTPLDRLRRQ